MGGVGGGRVALEEKGMGGVHMCNMGKEKKVYSSLDGAADSFLSSIKKSQRMMDESNSEQSDYICCLLRTAMECLAGVFAEVV